MNELEPAAHLRHGTAIKFGKWRQAYLKIPDLVVAFMQDREAGQRVRITRQPSILPSYSYFEGHSSQPDLR